MRGEVLPCLGFGCVVIPGIKIVRGQRQPEQVDAHGFVFFAGHNRARFENKRTAALVARLQMKNPAEAGPSCTKDYINDLLEHLP
jgi:hypothetical protein